jgi:DNA-binding XRE family transcriptional regulator
MSTNVCNDQKTFNKAVRKAINHIEDDDEKPKNNTARMIMVLITLTMYLWAVLLALKVSDKEHRVLHITLALLLGPLYVLSFYLGMMNTMTNSDEM